MVIYYERREEKTIFFALHGSISRENDLILKTVTLLRVATISRVWYAPSIPPAPTGVENKKKIFFPCPNRYLFTAKFEKTTVLHTDETGSGYSTSTLSLGNRDIFRTLGIKIDIFHAPSLDSRYYSYCPERFVRAYTYVECGKCKNICRKSIRLRITREPYTRFDSPRATVSLELKKTKPQPTRKNITDVGKKKMIFFRPINLCLCDLIFFSFFLKTVILFEDGS